LIAPRSNDVLAWAPPPLPPPLSPVVITPHVFPTPTALYTSSFNGNAPTCINVPPTDTSPRARSKRRNYRQYTNEQLNSALDDIKNGVTKSTAARTYGIPETTLRREEIRRKSLSESGANARARAQHALTKS